MLTECDDGGASGQIGLALPIRVAGDPAYCCPGRTLPRTAEPGATWESAPTRAPGMRVLLVPITARLPTLIRPMCTRSPSIHQPERSTSGSTEVPLPRLSIPVTGGTECRSTSRPIFAPSALA